MKHTVIDFNQMLETVNKDGRRHEYHIDELQVYEGYLHYKRNYVNHPYHQHIEYHLFPKENIGIYILTQFPNLQLDKAEVYKYYVDMVCVEQKPEQWIVKDLFLDFIVKCDGNYYVVDVDEFNDAIKVGQLSAKEIADALTGLDNVLKGYYKSFSMDKYIESLIEKYAEKEPMIYKNKRGLHYGT